MGHSHGPGHSHSHGHSHGASNTYLTSSDKNDPGVRITRIGLYVNLGMAIIKGVGGYVFNSKALTADAVHALTDLISDVTTLATISYSIRPATTRFPLGYGKVESLGALAVSCTLLSGGLVIGLQAVMALSQQFFPEIFTFLEQLGLLEHLHHHGHDHGALHVGPHIHAAWLAAGSILAKEWLYRATMKIAVEKRSSVLSSNAYHHRVDSLTAFVALFSIVAGNVLPGALWLDPVAGLVISGMIVQAGAANTVSALFELADVGLDKEITEDARKAASQVLTGHSDAMEIRGVQGIKSGQNLMFEVEVSVPADWTVARASQLEAEVRDAIAKNVVGTKRVLVRFITGNGEPFLDQFVQPQLPETAVHHAHDQNHNHNHEAEQDHVHSHDTCNSHSESAEKLQRSSTVLRNRKS